MNKLTFFLMLGALSVSKVNAQATVANSTNTVTASSYLGSGNNFDVLFKRNNIPAGKITTNSVFFGLNAGSGSTTTIGINTFIGNSSGADSSGYGSSFFGSGAGTLSVGNNNIGIGYGAGTDFMGNNNIHIGIQAGDGSVGSGNIFIGTQAGAYQSVSNKLIIANSEQSPALLWGDLEEYQLKLNAKVGVGYGFANYPTTAGSVNISNYNLFVKGGILTEEVRVALQGTWADYVFEKDYKLPTLDEVEKHIKENGHLINVPSANEVKENGINLGEMTTIQQEKIEELTLYIIEQNKINEKQNKEIEELKIALQSLLDKKQ